jgi:hypothetical protein
MQDILSSSKIGALREIDMKITASFRVRTMIAVCAVAAAMLVTVFGLRNVIDPNGTTARAGTFTASPAISVYDLHRGAGVLPAQQFDAI